MALAPAQVHPEQHFGPVLCLGAAGPRLYIQVGPVGIHFAGEHTTEFQDLQFAVQVIEIADGFFKQGFVLLFRRQFNDILDIGETGVELVNGQDNRFQAGSFPSQLLCVFRVIPDPCVGEFEFYLRQSFFPVFVVKDTP